MLKRVNMAKVSQLLCLLMLFTAMMPVFAFAAGGFKDVVYDGSTVTGSVYYEASQPDGVTVSVYTPDGVKLIDASTSYTSTDGNYYYYGFSESVTGDVYRYVDLEESVTNSVYQAVYDMTAPEWPMGVTLDASDVTRSSVMLRWSQATDERNDAVTYHVYRDNTLIGTVTDDVYYTALGLSSNTRYHFKVEASDSLGNVSTDGPSVNATTDKNRSGGGGGGYPPAGSTLHAVNGTILSSALTKSFEEHKEVEIKVSGDTLHLPVSALIEAARKSGAMLTITMDDGSYVIPLSALNLEDLAKAMSEKSEDITLKVNIEKLEGDAAKSVEDAAKAMRGQVSSAAIDFSLTLEAKDGKTMAITSFNDYISRLLPLHEEIDKTKSTIARYDETAKTFTFTPAVFTENEGKWSATAMSRTNSIYAALTFDKSFTDVEEHWAEAYIEQLANKLVVEGVSETKFEPERNITRAEFAALVVRALGIPQESVTRFADVSNSDWYAGVVGAAAKAEIVEGYEDGTFRPDAPITREELAAMVVRAMEFAGDEVELSQAQQRSLLAKFKDSPSIIWGHEQLAIAIESRIVDGLSDNMLGSNQKATRAQAATMLKRLLGNLEFIN